MKLLYKQTFRQLDYDIFKSNKIIKGEQNRPFKILSDVQIRLFQDIFIYNGLVLYILCFSTEGNEWRILFYENLTTIYTFL